MMLQQQFVLLLPLVTIFVLLAVLVLYVHYSTDRLYRIKLLLGPALLLACVGAFAYVGVRLGYGWPAALPDSFEYMAHRPIMVGHEKRWVDVLVVSRKPYKADPRLLRVPWSRTFEEALDKAQAMREGKEGGTVVLDVVGGGTTGGDPYPSYVPRRVLPQQESPKAPLSPRALPGEAPREPEPERENRSPRLTAGVRPPIGSPGA